MVESPGVAIVEFNSGGGWKWKSCPGEADDLSTASPQAVVGRGLRLPAVAFGPATHQGQEPQERRGGADPRNDP